MRGTLPRAPDNKGKRKGLTMASKVFIISPFRGDTQEQIDKHVHYAYRCVADCIALGEAPFAPHLIYPAVLNDNCKADRALGMALGQEWMKVCDVVAVYEDFGVTSGMTQDIAAATAAKKIIVTRKLGLVIGS